ncbi:MAG: hypothetical protein LBT09_08295 [Planctomycetaceae bacterium]|jgi:hypothetical protein|nr:hypothetical protein [Planctomycetaceae bacterium]
MRYIFFVLLLLPFILGCGNDNPQGRVPIRGEVTFDGKPLEQGEILFSSLPDSTPVVATGSPVKNGTFSIPAKQGLIPDQTYLVQFSSIVENQNAAPELQALQKRNKKIDISKFNTRNIIPPHYGVASKETVKAIKKSPNVFQFDLTSNAKE